MEVFLLVVGYIASLGLGLVIGDILFKRRNRP